MSIPPFPGGNRQSRRVIAGLVAAILLVALAVVPAAANAGSTKLSEPRVSPRAGTTATTFTFTVTYRNREGSAADSVVVVIDGRARRMTATGHDWKNGVTFRYSTRLATGTHAIAFRGSARDKFLDQLDAGRATVGAAPRPTSLPTPVSRPGGSSTGSGGTTAPSAHPTPSPAATGGGTAPRPTATPSGPPIPAPWPSIAGSGGSSTGGSSTGGSSTGGSSTGSPSGGSDPGGAGVTGGNAGDGPGELAVQFGGWGDVTAYLQTLGIGDTAPPMVRVLVSLVGSAGAMTLLMAFLFFGKRRRDGEPPAPDEVLSANAARGMGEAATATLVPPRQVVPGVPEEELGMPRWRRPSLLEARKADPSRAIAEAPLPLSFDRGAIGPVDGHERRLIRYHVVRLMDVPDEFQATEIGVLTHGDEVQLLERSGTYWLVLCPDGRQGWIHKMTLGEVVGGPSPATRDAWGRPQPAEPDDVDEDVLLAFMSARGRA